MINYFEEIYSATKNCDINELKRLLSLPHCYIDESKIGTCGHTVAAQCALEGDVKSAELLRTQFGANINYILQNAARKNNIDYVDQLIYDGADVHYAIQGFAQAGNFEEAKRRFSSDESSSATFFAKGAIEGKHFDWRTHLPAAASFVSDSDIIFATVQSGNFGDVAQVISNGANINLIASAAAIGGHFGYIKNSLTEQAGNPHMKKLIGLGAAAGGHFDYANSLINEEPEENRPSISSTILQGAIKGGHFEYANSLCYKPDIRLIIKWGIEAGHFSYIYRLVAQGADINQFINALISNGYLSNIADLLDIFILILESNQDQELFDSLLYTLKNNAKTAEERLNEKELSNITYQKIVRVVSLKKNYQLNNAEALLIEENPELFTWLVLLQNDIMEKFQLPIELFCLITENIATKKITAQHIQSIHFKMRPVKPDQDTPTPSNNFFSC